MSEAFGAVDLENLEFPATMRVDWVRVVSPAWPSSCIQRSRLTSLFRLRSTSFRSTRTLAAARRGTRQQTTSTDTRKFTVRHSIYRRARSSRPADLAEFAQTQTTQTSPRSSNTRTAHFPRIDLSTLVERSVDRTTLSRSSELVHLHRRYHSVQHCITSHRSWSPSSANASPRVRVSQCLRRKTEIGDSWLSRSRPTIVLSNTSWNCGTR